jgi:phosphopentomutase
MRAFLIVLDSVGIGEAPDAAEYGDAGSNTLAHTARAVGGLALPTLERMGLGKIPALIPGGLVIQGVADVAEPIAGYGAMREVSKGKDTTTGHWEMAGLELAVPFTLFPKGPPSFPSGLIAELERRTGRKTIGNKAASGTEIIRELGEQQRREGAFIVYTSADSVLQIAAHEEVIPIEELYRACEVARGLCNAYRVGRVIARPFVGAAGHYVRTDNRRDYSYPLPEATVLDRLVERRIPVIAVGKIDDIFVQRGISRSIHMENSTDAQTAVLELADREKAGLVFANLIDFDMRYGHRRDPAGYAKALADADRFLGELLGRLVAGDWVIVTADHGNDPTFRGTDHTREFVPLLAHRPGEAGRLLGVRQGFYDVAQSLASFFGMAPMPRGRSFFSA